MYYFLIIFYNLLSSHYLSVGNRPRAHTMQVVVNTEERRRRRLLVVLRRGKAAVEAGMVKLVTGGTCSNTKGFTN